MRQLALFSVIRRNSLPLAMAALSLVFLSACGGDEVAQPPVVASVIVTAESDTLFSAGETTQLSATARDAGGNVMAAESFTWTSSDEAVVTVDASGLATAAGPNGSATISASTGGVDGAAAIDVVTGPQGGTVIAAGGLVTLEVPAAAVTGPLTITVEPVTTYPAPERVVGGTVFEFGPAGTEFSKPVGLIIQYEVDSIPTGIAEDDVRLQNLFGDIWIDIEGSTLDVSAKRVTGAVSHFSVFGVGANAGRMVTGSCGTDCTVTVQTNTRRTYHHPGGRTCEVDEGDVISLLGPPPFDSPRKVDGVTFPDPKLANTFVIGYTYALYGRHKYPQRPYANGPDDILNRNGVYYTPRLHEWAHVYQYCSGRKGNDAEADKFAESILLECMTGPPDWLPKPNAPTWCAAGPGGTPNMQDAFDYYRGLDPNSTPGNANGDVHMRTPDGLAYDFQGAGEYLFVASADGDVVVQVRMEPWGSSKLVTVNTAVAMDVNGDRVGVYVGRSPALYVNGQPTEMTAGTLDLAGGGRINRFDHSWGTDYVVQWPNGFLTSAKLRRRPYIDVGVSRPSGLQGTFEGLVGNLNGQAEDDLRTRDGITLGSPILFDELYRSFGDSWRVSAAESLFDYEPGTSTETFQLYDFPLRRVTTADFDQSAIDAARQICEAAGIEDPILLEDCILDLVATGEDDFVESALDSEAPGTTVAVVQIVNGGFDLDADGWFWENINVEGGWRSAGGNPAGHFILNQAGETATDPRLCQVVEGLEMSQTYRITGDYASYKPQYGNPAKPNAFAVTVDGAVILELPRPTPSATDWTGFSTDLTTGTEDPTICFVAERDGDDSSFRVDNIALKGN